MVASTDSDEGRDEQSLGSNSSSVENNDAPSKLGISETALDKIEKHFADQSSTAEEQTLKLKSGQQFGDYELDQEIGRGGMGVVFKARQISLDRDVAIKILPGGQFAAPDLIERFAIEATAAGSLDHPNIVPVFHTGQEGGTHFLVMKLIKGVSLSQRIQKQGPLNPKIAAQLIIKLAGAISLAHNREIIHRDLKPANVLIDEKENPWIVDFGLAKRLNDDSNLTVSGWLIGTPAYLSPEQADGKNREVTKLVDIYGLGGILYSALTGNRPHSAHTTLEVLKQVLNTPPVRPRDINPSIPAEMETICLKCLAKNPADRYQTAGEVAEDLERFLSGRPILARPEAFFRRGWKWAKRNRLPISIMAGLVLGVILTGSGWWQARNNLRDARTAQARSLIGDDRPGRRFEALDAIEIASSIQTSPELRDLAIQALSNVDVRVSKLFEADNRSCSAVDGKFSRYADCNFSGEITIRKMDDDSIICILPETGRRVQRLEFTADGNFLAAAYQAPADSPSEHELFRIWNLKTQTPLDSVPDRINGNAWSFDNHRGIAIVGNHLGEIVLSELNSDMVLQKFVAGTWMRNIAISPNSKWLAISRDNPNRIEFSLATNNTEYHSIDHDYPVLALAWTPNSKQLISASGRQVICWDALNGKRIWTGEGHQADVARIAVSVDGQTIASTDWEGRVNLWRRSDGARLLETSGELWIRFSDDGTRLAGATQDNRIGVWNFSQAPEAKVLSTPGSGPQYVSFSQFGQLFATSGVHGIRLWRSDSPNQTPTIVTTETHGNLQFLYNGLVSASATEVHYWPLNISTDGSIELGKAATDPIDETNGTDGKQIASNALGKVAVIQSSTGTVLLRNLATTSVNQTDKNRSDSAIEFTDAGGLGSVALSPDGKFLATGTINQRLSTRLWNAHDGELICQFDTGDAIVSFTPDGQFLIIGSESSYQFIDLENHKTIHQFSRDANLRGPMACCATNQIVAIGESQDSVSLINWQTGQRLARLKNPTSGSVSDLCFSKDGKFLGVASESGQVILWDLAQVNANLDELNLAWD